MFLDKELSQEAELELIQEIQRTPGFKEILSKEKSFREFLKNKVARRPVSPALIDSIKEKIRTTEGAYIGQ
jgi:hypothetical protein